MSKEKIKLLRSIGEFFLQLKKNDHAETARYLRYVEITQIEKVNDHEIVIIAHRPGLLVGKKGEIMRDLERWLGLKVHIAQNTQPSVYDYLIL